MRLVMTGCDNCQALFYREAAADLVACPRCGWQTGLPGDMADELYWEPYDRGKPPEVEK